MLSVCSYCGDDFFVVKQELGPGTTPVAWKACGHLFHHQCCKDSISVSKLPNKLTCPRCHTCDKIDDRCEDGSCGGDLCDPYAVLSLAQTPDSQPPPSKMAELNMMAKDLGMGVENLRLAVVNWAAGVVAGKGDDKEGFKKEGIEYLISKNEKSFKCLMYGLEKQKEFETLMDLLEQLELSFECYSTSNTLFPILKQAEAELSVLHGTDLSQSKDTRISHYVARTVEMAKMELQAATHRYASNETRLKRQIKALEQEVAVANAKIGLSKGDELREILIKEKMAKTKLEEECERLRKIGAEKDLQVNAAEAETIRLEAQADGLRKTIATQEKEIQSMVSVVPDFADAKAEIEALNIQIRYLEAETSDPRYRSKPCSKPEIDGITIEGYVDEVKPPNCEFGVGDPKGKRKELVVVREVDSVAEEEENFQEKEHSQAGEEGKGERPCGSSESGSEEDLKFVNGVDRRWGGW